MLNCNVIPLANLKQLESLALGENLVRDVSPLSSLTKLTNLYLYLNHVTYLSSFLKVLFSATPYSVVPGSWSVYDVA
jgi:hypothetical protein